MATNLKSLAKDTAIYGVSSIFGRFLNYLLVPLYTATLSAASGGYGVITNLYAWTALLLVILTYGMETTFFRFANKADEDAEKVTEIVKAKCPNHVEVSHIRGGQPVYYYMISVE